MQPFEQLEKDWAAFNNLDPAGMVACSSGTAALHLALESFQLPLGSEVIVPDFTMIACARAVTLAGLTPVFVDCDERLLMDVKLTGPGFDWSKVGAVMLVHIYGRKCDDGWWNHWAVHQGVKVVEDLAEAHGAKPHPETDAMCTSFYKNKIVAGEEGGAVWFRDPAHAALARQLRSLGFTEAHDFDHVPRGHNYRMSNAHAELILTSLANYDCLVNGWEESHQILGMHVVPIRSWKAGRREIESWYDEFCPAEWRMPPRDAVWVYDLRIPGLTRDKQRSIVEALNAEGIAARMSFLPMSRQQEYKDCRTVSNPAKREARANDVYLADYLETAANAASREVFYLPVQPGVATRANCRKAFDVIGMCLVK